MVKIGTELIKIGTELIKIGTELVKIRTELVKIGTDQSLFRYKIIKSSNNVIVEVPRKKKTVKYIFLFRSTLRPTSIIQLYQIT